MAGTHPGIVQGPSAKYSGRGARVVALALVVLLAAASVATAAAPLWQPNTAYAVGARVTFDGIEYECVQAHTSQIGWEPPKVLALWVRVRTGEAWQPSTPYPLGTVVVFEGKAYRCLQGHTSQVGWEPPKVPALWSVLGETCAIGSSSFRLAVAGIDSSVWDTDGSVSLAIGLSNAGPAASLVRLDTISIANATRLEPASMPFSMGSMTSQSFRIADARFALPAMGIPYTVLLAGHVSTTAGSCAFAVTGTVTPLPRPEETAFDPVATTVALQDLSSSTFPPPVGLARERVKAFTGGTPLGPPRTLFARTTTETAVVPPPLPANFAPVGDPEEVLFARNTRAFQFPNNVVVDPSTSGAEASGVVLFSSNGAVRLADPATGREAVVSAFLGVSLDGGATFRTIDMLNLTDPDDASRRTFFPEVDGGLCCDQMVHYVPRQNLFVWVGLYSPPDNLDGGRLRVAFATPDDIRRNVLRAWRFFDITPADVTLGQGFLDFPDLAFSDRFLYVTAMRARGSRATPGLKVAVRVPLEDLVNRAQPVRLESIRVPGPGPVSSSRLIQQSAFAMVWAAPADTSTLSFFSWPDGVPNALLRNVKISRFIPARNVSLPGPSGRFSQISQFSQVDGATATEETCAFCPRQQFLYFAFNALPAPGDRPRNMYVRVVKVNPIRTTAEAETDIFNDRFAFVLPSLGARPAPHSDRDIALSLGLGLPTGGFLENAVGFLGDFRVFQTSQSTATGDRYADFFQVRSSVGPDTPNGRGLGFSTLAFALSDPGGTNYCARRCTVDLQYVMFGRRRELFPEPPRLTVQKALIPASDTGRFDLRIDGVAHAFGVGDMGTTGPVTLAAGDHRVGESGAAGTDLNRYQVQITGDCAGDGRIRLRPGDTATCLILNTAPSGCRADCEADRDACMEDSSKPGFPRPIECAQQYMRCLRRCPD